MGAAECVREVSAFEAARGHLAVMEKRLSSPEMMHAEHGELEKYVMEQGMELQRRLLQAHMELRAAREQRVSVRGSDGVLRTTMRSSKRPLMTLVGKVDVPRTAYQARGIEGLHPMDAALNLSPTLYSHGVERFVAELAAIVSFDDVRHAVLRQTGARVAKRQVEEMAVRAAADFDAFYAERRTSNEVAEETSDLLVLTFDGKGIVMVPEDLRPATKKAAQKKGRNKLSTRLASGEKRNRKRMAEVAAIYTVAPFVRGPLDVLADLRGDDDEAARRERHARRPRVRNKRVWASVEKDPKVVIDEAFRDAAARDPKRQRRWVVLLDGNKDQLALVKAAAQKLGVAVTIVVDLMHVLEYLWRAAHAFCKPGSEEAEAWVQQRLMWLLQGRPAGKIATAMRRSAREANLAPGALATVIDTADYLQDYARYMPYGSAIADGLPIATGVIEGACRYLVRDRMERGGSRWTLEGAEAVLRLRALRASGDFDAYWALHLREELQRNHAERYAGGRLPDPLRPLRALK